MRSLSAAALGVLGSSAWAVTELPKVVQVNVPLTSVRGESSSETVYKCAVPEGAFNLRFTATGGTGDSDLFVRYGAHPTVERFDEASRSVGSKELIVLAAPTSGVWYMMLYGFSAYTGVTVTMRYDLPVGKPATPLLSPGPGSFMGPASVTMTSTRAAKIYYTLDGSEPTALSTLYTKPVVVSASATLKARAYLGVVAGGVMEGGYDISAVWPPVELQNGVASYPRCGNRATTSYFKVSVPAGQKYLRILTSGGSGDSAFYLRHSYSLTSVASYYNSTGNWATVTIANPLEGDWVIGLRGLSDFTGVSLLAQYGGLQGDLMVWPESMRPYATTESFLPGDCVVQEGTVAAGARRLLRFTTETRNIGSADIVLGNPVGDSRFIFFECHGHYHFNGFAAYRLLNLDGELVAVGKKASFCIEDVRAWDPKAPVRRTVFTCDYQGLHMGWADIYDSGLPGQWVDITGVPPGEYVLEVIVNSEGFIPEANYENNATRVRVRIN